MVNGVDVIITHIVCEVWSREYKDHSISKSKRELNNRYTMLEYLCSVIVGGVLIHKNREGRNQECRRIHPTTGNFGGNCISNQSSFNNIKVHE